MGEGSNTGEGEHVPKLADVALSIIASTAYVLGILYGVLCLLVFGAATLVALLLDPFTNSRRRPSRRERAGRRQAPSPAAARLRYPGEVPFQ